MLVSILFHIISFILNWLFGYWIKERRDCDSRLRNVFNCKSKTCQNYLSQLPWFSRWNRRESLCRITSSSSQKVNILTSLFDRATSCIQLKHSEHVRQSERAISICNGDEFCGEKKTGFGKLLTLAKLSSVHITNLKRWS